MRAAWFGSLVALIAGTTFASDGAPAARMASASDGAAPAPTEFAGVSAPVARVDLTTTDGVSLVKAQWRYSDARLIEVPFRARERPAIVLSKHL